MAQLSLPIPFEQQGRWLDAPHKRKILPQGRRGGKSRGELIASVVGHGTGEYGQKQFAGILQGVNVVWFAQDYPNLKTVIWNEEIVPRFKGQPYCDVNENDMRLTIHGRGSLYLRSAEAMSGVRGIGRYLGGVVIDEAAWLDLKRAILTIILPALADHDGWLVVGSTTNCGLDGNSDRRIPSYFNLIYQECLAGKREDWGCFPGTAFDNPHLSHAVLQELIAEYPPGSPELRQEIFAELLAPGGGSAFPMLDRRVHLIPAKKLEAYWTFWGAFDWGYDHPWIFGLFAADEHGTAYLVDSVMGRGDLPDAIAVKILTRLSTHALRPDRLYQIAAGHDTWHRTKARGEDTPTIAERLARKGLTRLVQANTDRIAGLNNMRWYLSTIDGAGQPIAPGFRIFDTVTNQRVLECLERTVLDPRDPEKALKVNAVGGQGGDDPYDMVSYGLAARPYQALKPEDEELADINARDVLLHEHQERRRCGNIRGPLVSIPRRDIADLDPMFGAF